MKYAIVLIFLALSLFSENRLNAQDFWIPDSVEIAKIDAAIPSKAPVMPAKPRKILVISLAQGYVHQVAPFGEKAIELMAQKTNAFDAVISNDIAWFEPEKLQQFDAVVFNNTNNEFFLPANFDSLSEDEQKAAQSYDYKLKNSFVNFLKNGKGLVLIHAGVASFRKWPEFGKIGGARFDMHPWGAGSTVTVKVEDSANPLVKMFSAPFFEVTDEIYQVKAPYSRKNLQVLLSLDTTRTNMNVQGINRTDGDFALSWIKNYGKGRVFYFAFGHEKHIFRDKELMAHLLAGIQWGIGDLEVKVKL